MYFVRTSYKSCLWPYLVRESTTNENVHTVLDSTRGSIVSSVNFTIWFYFRHQFGIREWRCHSCPPTCPLPWPRRIQGKKGDLTTTHYLVSSCLVCSPRRVTDGFLGSCFPRKTIHRDPRSHSFAFRSSPFRDLSLSLSSFHRSSG